MFTFKKLFVTALILVAAILLAGSWWLASRPTLSPSPLISPTTSPQQQTILLNLTGGSEKEYRLVTTQEITVADLLTRAQKEQGLQITTKDFGGSLGILVEEMNGIHNDQSKQMYWTLSINGKRSEVGASSAHVKPGDTVTWKYEHLQPEQ
jgi:hypothetical protein